MQPSRRILSTNNRDSAETKSKAETKVHGPWERGLRFSERISSDGDRAVQDQILSIRQTNTYVPDSLDNLRQARNETVMEQIADHLIEEAVSHGKTR